MILPICQILLMTSILSDDISNLSEREATCFNFKVSYKSGEFTEYQLYNGLNEMPDQEGKIIAYLKVEIMVNCVNLPHSWSAQYKEISQPDTSADDAEALKGSFNYLTKYDKCPKTNNSFKRTGCYCLYNGGKLF